MCAAGTWSNSKEAIIRRIEARMLAARKKLIVLEAQLKAKKL